MKRLRAWLRLKMGWIPRPVRRVIVSVIGGTLLVLALAGMALPILPGVIFLPLALAILAVEFAWAARWLKKLKRSAKGMRNRLKNGWHGAAGQDAAAADSALEADASNADHLEGAPKRSRGAIDPSRRNAAA